MNLPNHMRADIRDGMDPTIATSVFCTRCEKNIGHINKVREEFPDQDLDTIMCEGCEEPKK